MDRQVNSELDTMTRFYSKAVNKVNKKAANYKSKVSFDANTMILSYKVMQFHIYDVEKKHKSSGCVRDLNRAGISTEVKNKEWVFSSSLYSHELNALVSLLLMEIRKRYKCESECNKNSCLYRCFSDKKHGFTNVGWLEDVVVNDDLETDKDVLRVARSLLSLQPSFCSKALIYGLQFRSRGSIYREHYEDCKPPFTRFGAEKKYDAREDLQWKDKANYSSWCMFQQSDFKIPTNKVTQTSLRYGKLNAFFEICIGDRSIDGMLVASITSHKVRPNSGLVDIVDRLESLDPSIIFVALQDVYPTRIAIVAIAANGKPNKINNTVTKEDKKFVNVRSLHMEMSYSYMLKMDADKMSRFPIYRPWTLYLSSSNKSGGSSSSTKTSVNLADENFDFNTNGFVMQPHRNSCSSTSKLRVLANRKSSKWKLHASSAFSDRPNSVEPSHSLLHAPPVSQDKQSNSSNSSYSNSKPPKYGFQMRPFNSIYAFEDNPHLYKPFPQDTGSQLRTYASPAFIDRSKSVEPSHSLLHAPFVPQDKQSNSSKSSYSNSKPPKYGFQMRPQNSISALADDRHLYKPFPQVTGSQLRTYASVASVNQSKSILTTVNAEHLHQQRTSKASEAESHSPTEHTRDAPDTETISSNSSLSVQSSGPMDLVSASCNISSLRDVELTEDDRMELSALLSGPADQEVLIHKYNIPMTRKKISCLKPKTWLNDEVINFYVEMMMQEGGSIHSFNTFFMLKLYENESYTFNNVAKWTKKVDIFRQKKVFIPINLVKSHWVLVVIDLTMKTIFFYDGYKGHGDKTYYAPFLSLTRQVLLSMNT